MATTAFAQPPSPPPFYAITDVRVVTGTDEVLDGATVVLGDGLIEAVGAGVEVPGDAWVIDGSGLSLYPGLIDGLSDLGQKKAESSEGAPSGGGRPPLLGPEDRPKTTPWRSAADLLGDDSRVDTWREAGFTAAVSSPKDGIFAGQAALVHLGSAEGTDRVLSHGVAQRVNFDRGGFGSFPSSLMGVLFYVKQLTLDARHYAQSQTLYAASPTGRERPHYDRALEPLASALADGTRFLLPGNLPREIDRALALQDEIDLPVLIYGAQGAYERADELGETPSLVNLNWPKEEKDRDPNADTPFRTLYHRRMAVHTPRLLASAGAPFAFYSGGLGSPAEFFKGVRKAIEAGLSEADALAALTRGPAAIYGAEERLGTIERGKIANLVLASGPPWQEDVEIAAVFVDGRKYETREPAEESEPPAADVSGTWNLSLVTPSGARDMEATVEMAEDGKVTGEIQGESGATSLDEGRMSADLLRFKTTRSMGGREMTASWSLTVEGESLAGSMSAGPMSMDVSGVRTAAPAAGDTEETEEETAEEVSIEELRAAMALYQGPVRTLDTFAITGATVWTVSGATIDNGTVVVRDGKIAAVGADVEVPRGAEVIDAQGGALIPGIIDAHSHIAGEGGLNEGSLSVTSMVEVEDVLNPDDIAIYRALAGGVTAANILHGSANAIGGQNQMIKMRWGADAEEIKIAGAPEGIKFALGENPRRSNFSSQRIPERYPQSRMGVMDVIRDAFVEATDYQRAWQEYERERSAGGRSMPPRRDLKLEALVEILEGERLVHSHCYRADEILQLLRLAEDFGFRVATLQHVLEGYKIADEIAAHGAGASTFSDWWGYKVEAYDAIPHNAALMAERGVNVSINSDSGEEMRHLNQEAAKAIKWGGMDEVEALKTVTLNPAIQFGLDDRMGSIEVGKDADLVLYDGHPMSITSVVQKTFVDGDLYFDLEADRERQTTIDALKERLMGKSEDGGDEEGGDGATESEPSPEVTWQDSTYTCREVGT